MKTETSPAIRALVAYAALRTGAAVGDFFVQTDHQAKHKDEKTSEGRKALAAHSLTYGVTQGVLLIAANRALGTNIRPARIFQAVAFSTLTHAFIDQRWPIRKAAKTLKKEKFHDMAPPLGGAFHLDQSAHHLMEAAASMIVARD